MDPTQKPPPPATTNLCASCNLFFHNEAEQRRKSRWRLLKNTSPADWAPYALRIHADLTSLGHAAVEGCSLCFPLWRVSLLDENRDMYESRFAVYLSTNPGGRSPTMSGQVCSLFGVFVPGGEGVLAETDLDARML
jgi:hypothetical protein